MGSRNNVSSPSAVGLLNYTRQVRKTLQCFKDDLQSLPNFDELSRISTLFFDNAFKDPQYLPEDTQQQLYDALCNVANMYSDRAKNLAIACAIQWRELKQYNKDISDALKLEGDCGAGIMRYDLF